MFQSYIIVHPDPQIRNRHVSTFITSHTIHSADIFTLNTDTVGITEIRRLILWLSTKPFASTHKLALIETQGISLEAQQALLKTLEEPPPSAFIFMLVQQANELLPTIRSRCTEILLSATISDIGLESFIQFWEELFTASYGKRLKKTDTLPQERQPLIEWIDAQLPFLQKQLRENASFAQSILPKKIISMTIGRLFRTKRLLLANVSIKLALDNFLLTIPVLPSVSLKK